MKLKQNGSLSYNHSFHSTTTKGKKPHPFQLDTICCLKQRRYTLAHPLNHAMDAFFPANNKSIDFYYDHVHPLYVYHTTSLRYSMMISIYYIHLYTIYFLEISHQLNKYITLFSHCSF